jgi:hypothetical protein
MATPTLAFDWMHEHEARPLRYNLSGSTGPVWTLSQLLGLENLTPEALADDLLIYAPITRGPSHGLTIRFTRPPTLW